jgi:hypothetical protein
MRPPVFDPSIQVLTGHFRHPQVTQNDIVAVIGEQFEGSAAVGRAIDMVPGPPERVLKQVAGIGLIFDHQDTVGHCLDLFVRYTSSCAITMPG